MNSRGQILGSTTVLFIVTVFIVLILLAFVIFSGTIKKIEGSGAGLKVYGLSETGLDNMLEYMNSYQSLLEKLFLEGGKNG